MTAPQHELRYISSHDNTSVDHQLTDIFTYLCRNPLSAILNAAELSVANHDNMATALETVSEQVDSGNLLTLLEEARNEVSLKMRQLRPPRIPTDNAFPMRQLEEASESIQAIIASARHQSLIAVRRSRPQ